MALSLYKILNVSQQDMICKLLDLDIVSNNLANINTIGYKSERGNFQEMLLKAEKSGLKLSSTQILNIQGGLRNTGNPMDWAIQGEGFFSVKLPDGTTGYTRDGQFKLDGSGKLVNSSGHPLVWTGTLPEGTTAVSVQPDGRVMAQGTGGIWAQAGTLQLTTFPNPTALDSYGENILIETVASGKAVAGTPGTGNVGFLTANALEQSTVNYSEEITRMISLQRSFQMSTKAFQTTDTMISQAINMRR